MFNTQTRAVRDGDHYVVNGQKIWTTIAHLSNWYFCLVRVPGMGTSKYDGLTVLLMEMNAPGMEIKPIVQITGESEFNEVFMTDARVPVENRLGAEGEGWKIISNALVNERNGIAGGMRQDEALQRLIAAAKKHGRAKDPMTRQQIAELAISCAISKYSGLSRHDRRAAGTPEPAPVRGDEARRHVARAADVDRAPRRCSAPTASCTRTTGRASDARVAAMRWLGDRAQTIAGGTSEIQKNIVAERILGLPRSLMRPGSASRPAGALSSRRDAVTGTTQSISPREFVERMTLPVQQAMAAVRWLEGRVRNRPKVDELTPEKAALTDGDCVSQEILLVALRAYCAVDLGDGRRGHADRRGVRCRTGRAETVVIDPIDGTARYLRGDGPYAILVGLEREGRVEAALVAVPQFGVLARAVRGGGVEVSIGDAAFAPVRAKRSGAQLLVSHGLPQDVRARANAALLKPIVAAGGAIGVAPLLDGCCGGLRIAADATGVSRRAWISALPTLEAGGCVESLVGPLPERFETGRRRRARRRERGRGREASRAARLARISHHVNVRRPADLC